MKIENVDSIVEFEEGHNLEQESDLDEQISAFDIEEYLDDLATRVAEKILDDSRFKPKMDRDHSAIRRSTREILDQNPSIVLRKKNPKIRDIIRSGVNKPFKFSTDLKFAQRYLDAMKIIYSELAVTSDYEFYLKEPTLADRLEDIIKKEFRDYSPTKIVDLLCRAESFVMRLTYCPTPAFIHGNETDQDIEQESLDQIQKRITNLGNDLITLLSDIDALRQFQKGHFLSNNIKIFLNYMANYGYNKRRREQTQDLLEQEIYFETLDELNHIICDLRSALLQGEFKLSPLNNGMLIRRQKEQIIDGVSIEESETKMVNYSKRLDNVTNYLKFYQKKNITLFRMRLQFLDKSQASIIASYKEFFTELNRKAIKLRVGFEGYENFFYLWSKDVVRGQFYQDIVLIIDTHSLLKTDSITHKTHMRNIVKEFEQYAYDFLDARGEKIFNGSIPEFKIIAQPILAHLELPNQLVIESGNRAAWSILEKKVLPFFLYQELLYTDFDEHIGGRFSRGMRELEETQSGTQTINSEKVVASS